MTENTMMRTRTTTPTPTPIPIMAALEAPPESEFDVVMVVELDPLAVCLLKLTDVLEM